MGPLLVYVGFVSAFISFILYVLVSKGKIKLIKPGRFFFHVASTMTIASAGFFLYLIISHQFQYTYVWENSSRELPINLLISTFYAGQEGSFHLWAFLTSVLGIFLLSYLIKRDHEVHTNKEKFEPLVMCVFTLIQSFLLVIMIIKSPYKLVWESFPNDAAIGFIPEDGRGLNPLLQNFWMTIHPPILFTGFTSLAVPFCFAVAALIKNEYTRWLKLSLPWTLFGGMILGLGIMLGGFWAYGVLGWGGYWGWDPVENSSFVPWIIIVAAIHSMVAEERTGKFKKTSLILCLLAYVLVLYSTFLTRSGILGDASVHSFVDPGHEVYIFLVVFLSLFGAGGIGLILYRLKSLRSSGTEHTSLLSRESAMFVGSITLIAAALVIAVGTSWPILSKGTVDPAFYNKMNLPLAILITVINGISILFAWKHTEEKRFIASLFAPLLIAGVVTIALVIFAVHDLLIAVFIATTLFALIVNVKLAFKLFLKNKYKAGPYIAHLGLMVLFLGIIGSSKYSEEENISLPLNEPKEALGYKLTYKGASPIKGDEDKYHFNVVVEKDGKGFLLQPVMYYSEYSKGVMKNPDIANLITKDVYLSPMSLEVPEEFTEQDVHSFTKGEAHQVGDLKIKFVDFDRSKFDQEAMKEGRETIIGATLEIESEGKKETVVTEQFMANGETRRIPLKLSNNDHYTLYLAKINVAGESTVDVAVVDESAPKPDQSPETFVLTASVKPFINFVWGGTIVMVLGFFYSLMSRYKNFKKEKSGDGKILHKHNLHNSNGNGKPESAKAKHI